MLDGIDILLVEDSDEDAELTQRAFRKLQQKPRVRRAKDGAEALELLLADSTSGSAAGANLKVILLDLKLPKVSGEEVLRALKADARTKAIPVVVLTSSKEDRDLAGAYKLGVNSYIVKPVDFDKFMGAIEQLGLYWLGLNQPGKAAGGAS